MKLKWQWFLGGKIMLWIATIVLILFVLSYIVTFIVDPTSSTFMKIQNVDTSSIEKISKDYINSLEVYIDKPIKYRFVKYKHEKYFGDFQEDMALLGSFHEWNDKYYIDISINLYKMSSLQEVVKHETRHMIVQELKNKKVIDLTRYSEEIAQGKDENYNQLFSCSIELLKEKTNKE